jgi:hypothetical protein
LSKQLSSEDLKCVQNSTRLLSKWSGAIERAQSSRSRIDVVASNPIVRSVDVYLPVQGVLLNVYKT